MTAPDPAQPQPTTRDRLIAAAFRVVARDGLEAASVKTIAAEAELTPGLLHYHFPTKAALLEAVLRQALEGYLAASHQRRTSTAAKDQITALFRWARASVEVERDFFKVRLAFAAAALTNPDLAAVMSDLNTAAARETALTFAAARGEEVATARDLEIAQLLKATFDGVFLTWLNDPSFPIDAAAADVERAVRAWIA